MRKSNNDSFHRDEVIVSIKVKIDHLKVPIDYTNIYSEVEYGESEWHGYKECLDDLGNFIYQCCSTYVLEGFPSINRINDLFDLYLTKIDLSGHNHKDHFKWYAINLSNLNLPKEIEMSNFNSICGYKLNFIGDLKLFFKEVPDDISEIITLNSESEIIDRHYWRYTKDDKGIYQIKFLGGNYENGK